MGEDVSTLASRLARRLVRANATISAAESCTGGLLTSTLTDISGASRCFNQSWITYSNEAKIIELGVNPAILEENGAVSAEVAVQMAQGARRKANADVAISITGIAGPQADDTRKKVGEVYIGIATSQYEGAEYRLFSGDRRQNKLSFVTLALRKTIEIWDDHHTSKSENEAQSQAGKGAEGEMPAEESEEIEDVFDDAGEVIDDASKEAEWITPISEDWGEQASEAGESEVTEELSERGMDDIEWVSSKDE